MKPDSPSHPLSAPAILGGLFVAVAAGVILFYLIPLLEPDPPPVTPTTESQETTIIFEENFSSLGINSRWDIYENGGNLVYLDPGIRLEQKLSTNFPYLVSRVNPFPDKGSFKLEIVFNYLAVDGYGTGIAIAGCCEQNDQNYTSNEETTLFRIWQGTGGMTLVVLNFGTVDERIYFLEENRYSLGKQRAEILFTETGNVTNVTIEINGVQITTFDAAKRPDRIWLGNFKRVGSGEWANLEVESIKVLSLPESNVD